MMNEEASDELKALKNEIKDFCIEQQRILNKYDVSLFTKTRRVVEERNSKKEMKIGDGESYHKEVITEIDRIFKDSYKAQKVREIKKKEIFVTELEAIRTAIRYIRKDIPALLSTKNFTTPLFVLKSAYEKDGKVVRENMKKVTEIRKEEIRFFLSIVKEVHGNLLRILKEEDINARKTNPDYKQ